MKFIDNKVEINEVLTKALLEKDIALDTEFVWTRTFHPIPGLLQIKSAGEIHLIDLLIEDFPKDTLKELLESESVCKILHSPDQDLKIFHLFCGARSKNIFDTQLAYAFTGAPKQVSLARLCQDLINVEICKSQQVSDWTVRPLKDSQLKYAAEDVRYLIEIAELLRSKIQETKRKKWFEEESLNLHQNPNLYTELTPEKAYKKVKQFGRLPLRSLAYLQETAAYRHKLAQERNLTPNFIIHQSLLFKSALYLSKDYGDFIRNGFNENQLRRHYKALQKIAKRIHQMRDSELPQDLIGDEPSSAIKSLTKELYEALKVEAEKHNLDPGLMFAKSHIQGYLTRDNKNFLQGWRKEVLGDTFEKIISK